MQRAYCYHGSCRCCTGGHWTSNTCEKPYTYEEVVSGAADDGGSNDGRDWYLVRKCYCAQVRRPGVGGAAASPKRARCRLPSTKTTRAPRAALALLRPLDRVCVARRRAQLTQAEAYGDADNYALCANIVGKERHVTWWEWTYALLACVTNLTALPAAREAVRSQRHVSRRDHDRWLLLGTFGVVLTNAVGMLLIVYLPPGWIQKQASEGRLSLGRVLARESRARAAEPPRRRVVARALRFDACALRGRCAFSRARAFRSPLSLSRRARSVFLRRRSRPTRS